VSAHTISERRFSTAIDDLEALDMQRYPTLSLMRRAYGLRANVNPYDAIYVALAEVLGCEFLTGDQRLANAPGPRCSIRLLR
jgi:predicted nucleic acid-binding protein